jgi:hypothetical protein
MSVSGRKSELGTGVILSVGLANAGADLWVAAAYSPGIALADGSTRSIVHWCVRRFHTIDGHRVWIMTAFENRSEDQPIRIAAFEGRSELMTHQIGVALNMMGVRKALWERRMGISTTLILKHADAWETTKTLRDLAMSPSFVCREGSVNL